MKVQQKLNHNNGNDSLNWSKTTSIAIQLMEYLQFFTALESSNNNKQ